MEQLLGEIKIFGGNFAPAGWAFCRGQLLTIADNTALFSLLGTTYGGNGTTTFGLPNLQGRVPLHQGTRPGGSAWVMGEQTGAETVQLLPAQIPTHSHTLMASAAAAESGDPGNRLLAHAALLTTYSPAQPNVDMAPSGSAGGSQEHENRQPYLAVNFIIALEGAYPTQS